MMGQVLTKTSNTITLSSKIRSIIYKNYINKKLNWENYLPRDYIMKAIRMGKLMVDCYRKRHKVSMTFPRKIH